MHANTQQQAIDSFQHALQLIGKEFESLTDGKLLTEKVTTKLQATFDHPPKEDFEFIVHKNFTEDELRITLFNPRVEQIAHLAKCLQVSVNVPSDHRLRKLGGLILTLIYLVHRKNWSFLEEFIANDGLLAFVPLIIDSNLYERSQALETMLSITDCDSFDWFAKPTEGSSASIRHTIHSKIIHLIQNTDFLSHLIQNRIHSYPGGSFRALQLLAFWLSWIRALYTKDQVLQLSNQLINEMHTWSLIGGGGGNDNSGEDDEEMIEEEKKLAKTLYEDFAITQFENHMPSSSSSSSRVTELPETTTTTTRNDIFVTGIEYASSSVASVSNQMNEETIHNHNNNNNETTTIDDDDIPPLLEIEAVVEEVEEEQVGSVCDMFALQQYKVNGNEYYKAGQYLQAIGCYEQGLEMITIYHINPSNLITYETNFTSNNNNIEEEMKQFEISFHCNISNAYWKLYEANNDSNDENKTTQEKKEYLQKIEYHCHIILTRLDSYHVKASYRLISVYIEQQTFREAYRQIQHMLDYLNISNDKNKKNVQEDIALFSRVKHKIQSLVLVAINDDEGKKETEMEALFGKDFVFIPEEWGLTSYDMLLLQSVLKRSQTNLSTIFPQRNHLLASNEAMLSSEDTISVLDHEFEHLEKKLVSTTIELASLQMMEENKNSKHKKNDDEVLKKTKNSANKEKDGKKEGKTGNEKKGAKEKSMSTQAPSILPFKKIGSKDVALIQQMKSTASSFHIQMLNFQHNTAGILPDDKLQMIKEYIKGVQENWSKGYTLRDIYGLSTEEADIFMILNIFIQWYHNIEKEGKLLDVSQVIKMIEQLLQCERLKSLVFLIKLEYGYIKEQTELALHKLKGLVVIEQTNMVDKLLSIVIE